MKKLKNIKCFILDIDGTVYLKDKVINGALDFIETLKSQDKSYYFLTNNSSENPAMLENKLNSAGFSISCNDIMTSGSATVSYLKNQNEKANIFLLGTPSLEQDFIDNRFNIVNNSNDTPDYVVVGYDTTMTYEKVSNACTHIQNGVTYIGTHPDMKFPLGDNMFKPDAGAIQEMINAATSKKPVIIGKPSAHIVDEIIRKLDFTKEDVAIVGDRLYTDIQLGINADITSILVLSGETDKALYESSDIKANYVFESINELKKIIG